MCYMLIPSTSILNFMSESDEKMVLHLQNGQKKIGFHFYVYIDTFNFPLGLAKFSQS